MPNGNQKESVNDALKQERNNFIAMVHSKITELFGRAEDFVRYVAIHQGINELVANMDRLKAKESDALKSGIKQITTGIGGIAAYASVACPPIAVVTGVSAIIGGIAEVGFSLNSAQLKSNANMVQQKFLNNLLEAHRYMGLLQQYLLDNKEFYVSFVQQKLKPPGGGEHPDLPSIMCELIREGIHDLSTQASEILYIRHAFLYNCLSDSYNNNSKSKFINLLIDSIKQCVKSNPEVFRIGALHYNKAINNLLLATFPARDSQVLYEKSNGFQQFVDRNIWGGSGEYPLVLSGEGKRRYNMIHYFYFADRVKINVNENGHISYQYSKFVGGTSQVIKYERVNPKETLLTLEFYPPLVLEWEPAIRPSLLRFSDDVDPDPLSGSPKPGILQQQNITFNNLQEQINLFITALSSISAFQVSINLASASIKHVALTNVSKFTRGLIFSDRCRHSHQNENFLQMIEETDVTILKGHLLELEEQYHQSGMVTMYLQQQIAQITRRIQKLEQQFRVGRRLSV